MTKLEKGHLPSHPIVEVEGDYRLGYPYGEEIKLCKHITILGKRDDNGSSEYGGQQDILCHKCKIHFILSELIN